MLTGIGRASPSSFELVMENGFHSAAEPREKFSLGFRHEGPFTASAPFCSSGYAVDILLQPPTELRTFTCADGTGGVIARKLVVRADAQFTQEVGTWTIVEGIGRYLTLRGKGMSVLSTISGDPADHITTRFEEKWTGVLDFDVTRPVVLFSEASGRRLKTPRGTYIIRIVFSARDGSANDVSYALTVSGAGVFVHKTGETKSGTVAVTSRVRPRRPTHALRLTLVATDPVGNEIRVTKQLRLPS
jgi:hypothetical protein